MQNKLECTYHMHDVHIIMKQVEWQVLVMQFDKTIGLLCVGIDEAIGRDWLLLLLSICANIRVWACTHNRLSEHANQQTYNLVY